MVKEEKPKIKTEPGVRGPAATTTAKQAKPDQKPQQKPKATLVLSSKATGGPSAPLYISHAPPPPTNEIPRGMFCDRLPRHHNAGACHQTSQQRRVILNRLKRLVDIAANSPVCHEWDTQSTLNNTPGPYRFGVYQPIPVFDQDDIKTNELIGSQMIRNCDCLKRNGLQDDCRRLDCRGSPECLVHPFPQCAPFWNEPSRSKADYEGYENYYQPDSYSADHY